MFATIADDQYIFAKKKKNLSTLNQCLNSQNYNRVKGKKKSSSMSACLQESCFANVYTLVILARIQMVLDCIPESNIDAQVQHQSNKLKESKYETF